MSKEHVEVCSHSTPTYRSAPAFPYWFRLKHLSYLTAVCHCFMIQSEKVAFHFNMLRSWPACFPPGRLNKEALIEQCGQDLRHCEWKSYVYWEHVLMCFRLISSDQWHIIDVCLALRDGAVRGAKVKAQHVLTVVYHNHSVDVNTDRVCESPPPRNQEN